MSVSSTPRVVGYLRKGTADPQRQTLSGQRESLSMPYTTLDGKQTVPPATRFYENEGVSGYSEWETRPGLAALIRDAGNGEFDVVRTTDADRLSRSRADQGSIIDTLEELGIEVIIHSADPSSPFGMTLLRMQASIAQDGRDFIGERIARAQPQGA